MKATSDSGAYCSLLKPEVAGEMQADHLDTQKKVNRVYPRTEQRYTYSISVGCYLLCHQWSSQGGIQGTRGEA